MNVLKRVRSLTVDSGEVLIGEAIYRYAVVSPKYAPRVPNFVGVLGGDELFISSDVPQRFRRAFIAHEVRCFALKDAEFDGYCVRAVEYELSFVSFEDMAEYLELRRTFFDGLIKYHEKKGADEEFLEEIRGTRDYLYQLT